MYIHKSIIKIVLILILEFTQVHYINLSKIVQFVKASITAISVHTERMTDINPLCSQSLFEC